ncbi:hypothetical protein IAU60_004045 [Kwoniella sp. DSM 27419]
MSPSSSAGPSRLSSPAHAHEYAPTSFTPMRTMLAKTNFRMSPSPPRSGELVASGRAAGADIFIDEVPRASPPLPDTVNSDQPGDHFEPPGLFGTSLMPAVTETEAGVKVELKQPSAGGTGSIPMAGPKGKRKSHEGLGGDQDEEEALLLPSHVLVDAVHPHDETDVEEGRDDLDDPMDGVHFVDDDISKGSKRYFDADDGEPKELEATFLATADQSKICQNCKRPGHRSKDCKHIICTTCGKEDDHERRDCPIGLVCFGCGGRGHRKQDCPDPTSRMSRRTGCDRCGSRDHMENTCPAIWRVYAYVSDERRLDAQKEKFEAEGWEKEAVGGKAAEEWCYNCAREGHFGDDCTSRRGSFARLTFPSAFSQAMASRGPFFLSRPSRHSDLPPPTHSRFDEDGEIDDYDNLPFITGGYKNFGGSNAGRKSREKDKARLMAREREQEDDDEPSWFDSGRAGPSAGRGRGGGRGAGGSSGYSTPNAGPGQRDKGRKPWDSEYRERTPRNLRDRSRSPPSSRSRERGGFNGKGNMPFSHGHLMSPSVHSKSRRRQPDPQPLAPPNSAPAKVISFGKLSAPGSAKDTPGRGAQALLSRALGGANAGNATPTARGKKGKAQGSPLTLMNTPEPPTPSEEGGSKSKRRKRNQKKNEEEGKDWERDWRKSGAGGGKVTDWGKDFDREDKEKAKAGGLGTGTGLRIKGRGEKQQNSGGSGGQGPVKSAKGTTGQRYHGGY